MPNETPAAAHARKRLVYIPSPRGCFGWFVDVAVVALIVALTLVYARRFSVACAWPERGEAHCTVEVVNAVGMRKVREIGGIHGLGHRTAATVHLVTDATNKDVDEGFGMRTLVLWDEPTAKRFEQFADGRGGSQFTAQRGPSEPRLVGLLAALALALYVFATRRRAVRVTVDRARGTVDVASSRGGPSRSLPLSSVRAEVVMGGDERARVQLRVEGGDPIALARDATRGAHHERFASELNAALDQ